MPAAGHTARHDYETRQQQWLVPCAVREADSGGRVHPQDDEDPWRSCFQQDRNRVLRCSAFRRLDFKTQVFVPHQHDHFRTRLTHTLEVAQIARDLARALRVNEDLAETVALAHDLGHPPFGHAGEAVLDELMAPAGGFEHNHQSLRVVDYLEHPYPGFRGLNLTQAVRECLAKHETRYDAPACGDFDPALGAPLEGQLVDLADEIAYTGADLEDALHSEWISPERLADQPLWQRAWHDARQRHPDAREIHIRIQATKGVLRLLIDDLLTATRDALEQLAPAGPDQVRQHPRRLARFSPPIQAEADQMQRFLREHVYHHPQIQQRERKHTAMIRELFDAYLADPTLLPGRYQRRLPETDVRRVACDYIAGMTDRFCAEAHARLHPPARSR